MKKKNVVILLVVVLIIAIIAGALVAVFTEKNKDDSLERAKKPTKSESSRNKEEKEDEDDENSQDALEYFAYNGKTYFWKYNSSSRDSGSVGLIFNYKEDSENELVSYDEKGKEKTILSIEGGSGKIYIKDDILYFSTIDDEVYSFDLSDKDSEPEKIGKLGKIQYVIGDYIYLYNKSADLNKDKRLKIQVYDLKEKEIGSDNVSYITLIGKAFDRVYFVNDEKTDDKTIYLGYFEDGKLSDDEIELPNISWEGSYPGYSTTDIDLFKQIDDKAYVIYNVKAGTGYFVQVQYLATLDEDNDYEILSKDFGNGVERIFKDGDKIYANETNIETQAKTTYELPSLEEVDYIGNTSNPEDVYLSSDYSEIDYAEDLSPEDKKIYSTDELVKDFSIENNYIKIANYQVTDKYIYILVDTGTHDATQDIGWRYYYKRDKTLLLRYNIEDEEMEEIYSF